KRPSAAERMGAVLALRRLGDAGLADFLSDSEPLVVVEAARAIHDVPVASAMPALAKLIGQPGQSDLWLRRSRNANYRGGTAENARAVAAVAANPTVDEA